MPSIAWFNELSNKDVNIAGGKGASLAEMYNIRLPIPPGFVVTAETFKEYINSTGIKERILNKLKNLNVEDNNALQQASNDIQELIIATPIPEKTKKEIIEAYDMLNVSQGLKGIKDALSFIKTGRDQPFVAVRSSATAEDLPTASFAGQQATFVNVKGNEKVVSAVQHCWASLYTARAIYYRVKNNFPHNKVYIAVVVQKMVNSEKAGVMFTINPATNEEKEIIIEGAYGLGDAVVAGEVSPDNYAIDKETLKIKSKKINYQTWMYFREENSNDTIKKQLTEVKGKQQKLSDSEIEKLARFAVVIEEHYEKPMDIEWAIEGPKIYIVQARPITTMRKVSEELKQQTQTDGNFILSGLGASPGIGSGKVKIVTGLEDINKVHTGDVLVAKMTSPDFVPAMEKATAIITDEGGLTSHASIVSREMGIPCVVGTEKATMILKDNQEVTVNGTAGKVYNGIIQLHPKKEEIINASGLLTKTKIYMNLSEPDKIDEYKDLPFDGIGLMRIEFIITSEIEKHPLYLIEKGQEKYYIDKLVEGIEKVAKAIHPKPIIVRFSDFKTNEYKNLEGGEKYEPHEENPMIGWRGVSRYISREFRPAFKLECQAIKKVREKYDNVHIMLPFVRQTDEVEKVISIIKEEGLIINHNFHIYLMAEVPSMAIIPEEFAKLNITGVSIGSNDLTQLTLGVDRDSAKLGNMGYFDERNPAVKKAIMNIIYGFKKHNKTVSICGQAPSEYPEIVKFLVEEEITAISVNPDVVHKVRAQVHSLEEAKNKL